MPDGIKMTADACIAFLREHREPRLKKQTITFEGTIIFMQDLFTVESCATLDG